MAYTTSNDVKVWYESRGEGPAVLLSHGYSATSEMWRDQLEAISQSGRQAIAWDMRGHGRTDSPSDQGAYSEAATIADMAAVLDSCSVERAVVGGLSLGGYMSLAFHLAHPERVTALMLFDTGPGYKSDKGRAGWNDMAERMAQRFDERGLDALGRGSEVRISTHRSPEGLARAARGMLAQRDARVIESLPNISVPTLVLVGGDDTQFHGSTDYLASRIPGARKVMIEGAGHAANIDAPEAFNRHVLAFLDSIEERV